jgi:hypothetical protein
MNPRDKDRTPTRAKEFTGEYTEPNTTVTPQGDNPDVDSRGTASLTVIEEEKNVRAAAAFRDFMRTTHGFQNQTASANEVTPKTESGTPPRHQGEASLENQRNPKRRRGSDGEYTGPTSTAALLGDIDTLTDTVTSQPDTKRCIQVGRETYAVLSQPGTSNTGQMALHIQVGRATSALTPVTDISRTVSGTPSIHHDEETITFYDSSANLTMESTSPQGYHRRKKNRTGQARHAKAQSGAPHRK